MCPHGAADFGWRHFLEATLHIDPTLLSPVSALLGAIVGGGASLVAAIYPILFAVSTLLMRSDGRARLPGARFHRLVRTCWAGVRGWQDRAAGALCPERQGAAGCNQRAMPANNAACGHEAAKAIRTRVAVSMTRAAILIRRSRKVMNSAFASGCGLGIASRRVSISQ